MKKNTPDIRHAIGRQREKNRRQAQPRPAAGQRPSITTLLTALAILLPAAWFCSCDEPLTREYTASEREAQALADSIHDGDELHRWLRSYERQGERRAALLVRQAYGKTLRNASQFEEAIAQHDSCISEAKALDDTVQLIVALNNQGTNLRRMGDNQRAADHHYAALDLCDAYSDKTSETSRKNTVRALNGLGNVLMSLGNNEAAEAMLRRALAGEKSLGSATGQAINLANLGSIKEKQGALDSARIYYNQSMEMNRETDNAVGIGLCYQYLGHLAEHEGDNAAAIDNFRRGYDAVKPTGDVWHWLEPCNALARQFLEQYQPDSARKYIEESLKAATTINSRAHIGEALALLSRLEELTGHPFDALQHLHASLELSDSLESEENEIHVQNLRVNYEASRRVREVQQAEEAAKQEKMVRHVTLWSAVIIAILLLVIITVMVRSMSLRKRAAVALQHANDQLTQAAEQRQRFYRNITHQLRTPLTVVTGMVNQLEKHISPDDHEGREELAATQRQSRELLELVSRLIKAAKDGVDVPLSDGTETPEEPTRKAGTATCQPGDAATHYRKVQRPNTSNITNGATVLIAEDNADVATLMQNIFQNNGYITTVAHDGQEALELLQGGDLPDLVISDIAMPRMDGLELIRRIRDDESMNHLPIIVVSARVEDNERLEGLDAGAEVYLAKPFIVDELLLRAQKLLEQRAVLRRKFSSQEDSDSYLAALEEEEKQFMTTINAVIDANIGEPTLSSNTLADHLCMSRSQLNRRVKNLTDQDTSHYIRARRLMHASHLLSTTRLSIGEVETRCGFDSPSYFSRAFKQAFDVSPSEFRKRLIEKQG